MAFINTTLKIERIRKNTREQVCARAFLQWVDVGKCVILAMLADAGDEAMMLIRVFDDEKADASEIAHVCWRFVANIKYVFVDANCVTLGYTKFMLDTLKKPILYEVEKKLYTLGTHGGVSDDILVRALQHMNCWVRLAIEVLRAECPGFELMQCFSVFRLCTSGERRKYQSELEDLNNDGVDEMLTTLANYFKVGVDKLKLQYADVYEVALDIAKTEPNVNNKEAWRRAVGRVSERWHKTRHPIGALIPVLVRWIGWVVSTSGLEHAFCVFEKLYGKRRNHMSRQGEQDLITLINDYNRAEEANVIEIAKTIWKNVYGRVRKITKRRARFVSRKGRQRNSESGWVKQRREAVRRGVASRAGAATSRAELQDLTRPHMTEDMCKEETFQLNKRRLRYLEGMKEGWIADADGCPPDDDPARFAAWCLNELRLEGQRKKRRQGDIARRATAFQAEGPTMQDMGGKRVFFDSCGADPDALLAMHRHGLTQTRDVLDADIVITKDTNSLHTDTQWKLCLGGGFVMLLDALVTDDGRPGDIVSMKPATATKRELWISTEFADTHPEITHLVMMSVARAESRWTLLAATVDGYFATKRRKPGLTLVALVTALEKATEVVLFTSGGFSSSASNVVVS